eukprot:TRINITY_DN821_c0_g3_i1.p1 TRINITY_DN821_c0_g3~~TRINITY_DN821_c0_g3_i1.p1  ORF type:complete len:191 (+),score=30.87 TRINITY_DN821_c0_g3_i1:53-625(+)
MYADTIDPPQRRQKPPSAGSKKVSTGSLRSDARNYGTINSHRMKPYMHPQMAAVRNILEEAALLCGGGRVPGVSRARREPLPCETEGSVKVKMQTHFCKVEGKPPTMRKIPDTTTEPVQSGRTGNQQQASIYDRGGIKSRWQHDLYDEPGPLRFTRGKGQKVTRVRHSEEGSTYATVNFRPAQRNGRGFG